MIDVHIENQRRLRLEIEQLKRANRWLTSELVKMHIWRSDMLAELGQLPQVQEHAE